MKLIKATVMGQKSLFCTPACVSSFREDRKHGLIYCAVLDRKNGIYQTHEAFCLEARKCAYCGCREVNLDG